MDKIIFPAPIRPSSQLNISLNVNKKFCIANRIKETSHHCSIINSFAQIYVNAIDFRCSIELSNNPLYSTGTFVRTFLQLNELYLLFVIILPKKFWKLKYRHFRCSLILTNLASFLAKFNHNNSNTPQQYENLILLHLQRKCAGCDHYNSPGTRLVDKFEIFRNGYLNVQIT